MPHGDRKIPSFATLRAASGRAVALLFSPKARYRSPMTLHGILLDKDGTLIDFDATWGPAAYEVMRTLADGDEVKLRTLIRISHYVEEERRFLPSSPLVAGSSAHYGPLWAAALDRPASQDLYSEMDELFAYWGLKTLAPIHGPAELCAALRARGLQLGIATNDAERSARLQAEALGGQPCAAAGQGEHGA